MFEESIAAGEALLRRLETDTKQSRERLPVARSTDVISFKEIESWKNAASNAIGRVLGTDPQSRFDYMWQLFAEEWNRARGPTGKGQETLRHLVSYLSRLETRLSPASLDRTFDWSIPLDPNGPSPELAEIEAKRWEFFRALLEDTQRQPMGTLDPTATGQRISLHPIHAREFFVSLVSSGHLNRESLTPEWRALADRVDLDQPRTSSSVGEQAQVAQLSGFLCHASEDKEEVRKLRTMIEQWGHDPWLDEEKLLPGQDWDREIRRAVERADVVIVCLSSRSEKRGYVQKEIKRALDVADEQPEGSIFLIPVKLTDCSVPDRLSKWHWVDLSIGGGASKLEAALQLRAAEHAQRRRGGPTQR
jgi:hypothetical protein